MRTPLSAEQEALAQELAQLLQEQSLETFLEISRDLVEATPEQLFGEQELKVRERLLALGVKAYQNLLEQKKTAMKAARSTVPTAAAPLDSTSTASEDH